jgi:hypothetical protein
MVNAEKNHGGHVPVPRNPVEDFCGIFKDGPSLTQALLAEREKERERKKKGSDDCTGKA